jgi:hypothetical protein
VAEVTRASRSFTFRLGQISYKLYHIVFLTNNEEIYDACMLLADFIYVRHEANLHI